MYQMQLTPTSSQDRETLVQQVRDAILSGEQDPIQAEVALKGIEETCDAIRKGIRPYVMQEVDKYPEKKFDKYGATISVADRKTYDFTPCGDDYLESLKAQKAEIDAQIKEREAFLKAIPASGVAHPETGEIIKPATFTSTPILTIKIK